MSLADVCCRCGYMLFPGLSMCVRNQSKFPCGPGVFPSFLVISQRNLGQHFNLSSADEPEPGAAQKSRFLLWLKNVCDFEYEGDFSLSASFLSQNYRKEEVCGSHYSTLLSLPMSNFSSRWVPCLRSWSAWRGGMEEEEKEGGIYLCANKKKKFWHLVKPERNVEIGSD